MAKKNIYGPLKKAGDKRSLFILAAIAKLQKLIQSVENKLFGELDDKLSDLQAEGGLVLNNASNRSLIAQIDKVITDFNKTEGITIALRMSRDFGKVKTLIFDYYELQEISAKRLVQVRESIKYIDKIIFDLPSKSS